MNSELVEIIRFIESIGVINIIQRFIPLISFYTVYYVTDKTSHSYKINKEFKPEGISRVSIPPELTKKYDDVDVSHIASKRIRNATLEFSNLLLKKFPSSVLTNFYNNINEVKIERNLKLLMTSASGIHSPVLNKIDFAFFSSIYHELFHMASSYYDKTNDISYCGFRQFSRDRYGKAITIGVGINEGYTEALAQRYFGEKHNLPKTYLYEVDVVGKLEKIIGRNNMEILYLNADLQGLINELKKYVSEDYALKFISSVDFVFKHNKVKNKSIEEQLKFIDEFLLNTYRIKLEDEFSLGVVDKEEFTEKMSEFGSFFSNKVSVGGYKYNLYKKDKLSEIISNATKPPELSTGSNRKVVSKQEKTFDYSDILLVTRVGNSIIAIINDKVQLKKYFETKNNDDLPMSILLYSDLEFDNIISSMKKIRNYNELNSNSIRVEYEDGESMIFNSKDKKTIENIVIEQRKALLGKKSTLKDHIRSK